MDAATEFYPTLAGLQAQKCSVQFVINNGGQWDETNSRMHCCDVVYFTPRYERQVIRKWAASIKEAYDYAVEAWTAEREAGRAL